MDVAPVGLSALPSPIDELNQAANLFNAGIQFFTRKLQIK
jgi:hypothetical protein